MGSIKIFNDTVAFFFSNNMGDVENDVIITEKESDYSHPYEAQYVGHFIVKTEAYLSGYDCLDEPIHSFGKGHWIVKLLKPAYFHIYKTIGDA